MFRRLIYFFNFSLLYTGCNEVIHTTFSQGVLLHRQVCVH